MISKRYRNIFIVLCCILVVSIMINVFVIYKYYEVDYNRSDTVSNEAPMIAGVDFKGVNNENVMEANWAIVPSDGKVKIIIELEGECTSIEMFITPTGTDTYLEQKMIAVIDNPYGKNKIEYIWEVPKGTLGHFSIIAYNGMVGTRFYGNEVIYDSDIGL